METYCHEFEVVGRLMTAIWIRALLYLLIVGGGWLVVLPAGLLLLECGTPYPDWNGPAFAAAGGAVFAFGFCLALWAGYCLIRFGHGTPLPLDPPRSLVTCGPYRRVRNPQAVAMVLMVAGETLAVRSALLWVLLPASLAYLELLVGPCEERQLTRDFGTAYTEYAKHVRKWLPCWSACGNPEPSVERERAATPVLKQSQTRPPC